MYDPFIIASYPDGRNVYQFECPDKIKKIKYETYYWVSISLDISYGKKLSILFLSKPAYNLTGTQLNYTAFYITHVDGLLPSCVYRDGGCVVVEAELTLEEYELEKSLFQNTILTKGN